MSHELYEVGSDCPDCPADIGTPYKLSHDSRADADHLYCPSCGCDWQEPDAEQVARAWFAAGAWEQKQRSDASTKESSDGGAS